MYTLISWFRFGNNIKLWFNQYPGFWNGIEVDDCICINSIPPRIGRMGQDFFFFSISSPE